MIANNELTEYSVVRVNRHLCNNMQGKKVVVIIELEVLQPGSEVSSLWPFIWRTIGFSRLKLA